MADFDDSEDQNQESSIRPSRPTLVQVKALVDFIQKHPDLAHRKMRNGVARQKIKKQWCQLSNIANSLNGAFKSTKGWIKFWSDKRRSIMLKQKQIDEGKLQDILTPLEQKIYDMCSHNGTYSYNTAKSEKSTPAKKRKRVKQEPSDEDSMDSMDNLFHESEELDLNNIDTSRLAEADDRQLTMMEKLVDVMAQQAEAMTQIAQASSNNAKALSRLAEASQIQALAVDRVASTFENINTSAQDVRIAMMSINYTMKTCYPNTATQQRQNSHLFS